MSIIQKTLCYFGLHEWGAPQYNWRFIFWRCKYCPAERIEERRKSEK